MRECVDTVYKISLLIAAISMVLIAGIICVQILLNLLTTLLSLVWRDMPSLLVPSYAQLSGYALATATFFAIGPALRQSVHIRITIVENLLPEAVQYIIRILVLLVAFLVAFLMLSSLIDVTYQSFVWGDKSVGLLSIPLWIPQLMMCLGILVFFIATLDTLIEFVRSRSTRAFKEADGTTEGRT